MNMESIAYSYADPQLSPLPQHWLWRWFIPRGCMTMIYGPGGKKKGFALADIIGRFTNGLWMPDGTQGFRACSVISITKEDRLRQGMAWRYLAAGARLPYIFDLSRPGGVPFVLDEQGIELIHRLARAINSHKRGTRFEHVPDLGFIYIDPLMAVAPCVLSNNVTFRQRVVEPLDDLAESYGEIGVGLVNHTTKDGHTVAGSAAATQAPRMVIGVDSVKRRPGVSQWGVVKTNIGPDDMDPVLYHAEGEGSGLHIVWDTEAEQARVQRPASRRLHAVPTLPFTPPPAPAPVTGQLSAAQIFANLRAASKTA
jgi:hypothetical protein